MSLQERWKDSRNPNSYDQGIEFEEWAQSILKRKGLFLTPARSPEFQLTESDTRDGIEFKLDNLVGATSEYVSVEIAERRNLDAPWVKSGIAKDANVWLYVQGNKNIFWVLPFRLTRRICESAKCGYLALTVDSDNPATVERVYLPIAFADNLAVLRYPDDFQ